MNKVSIAFIAVLSLVAACSKGSGGGGGGDCAVSVAKGIDRMASARMNGKDMPPDIKAKMDDFSGKMKAVIINRCNEDKWPAAVISCFETVSNRQDMMKCQSQLPQDQQDKVRGEVRDLMMSNGGLGKMNAHGMHSGMGGSGGAMGGSDGANAGSDGAGASATGSGSAAPTGSGGAAATGSGSAAAAGSATTH